MLIVYSLYFALREGYFEIVHLVLSSKAELNIHNKVCIVYRDCFYCIIPVLPSIHVNVCSTTTMHDVSTKLIKKCTYTCTKLENKILLTAK